MRFLTRFIVIATLAAFAASSVAHAAGSARMATEVIMADVKIESLINCEACDDDAANTPGLVCEFVCSSAAAAPLENAPMDIGLFPVSSAHGIPAGQNFLGLTSPPAEHPPRLFL